MDADYFFVQISCEITSKKQTVVRITLGSLINTYCFFSIFLFIFIFFKGARSGRQNPAYNLFLDSEKHL